MSQYNRTDIASDVVFPDDRPSATTTKYVPPIVPPDPEPEYPVISCAGATPTTSCMLLEGTWDVEVGGVLVGTNLDPQGVFNSLNGYKDLVCVVCEDEVEPPLVISCEGAGGEAILGVPRDLGDGRTNLDKVTEIWLNGARIAQGEDLLDLDISNSVVYGELIFIRNGGTMLVIAENESGNPCRVALHYTVGTEGQNALNIGEWNTNPTVHQEEGLITMCVLPAPENFPPYAELETMIPWGSVVDVEVKVGGYTYSGDLLNEVIDKLSENHNIHTALRATYDNLDNRFTSMVLAGDIFGTNLKVELKVLNSGAQLNAPLVTNYPMNDTLEVFGDEGLAKFNLGQLVCDMGTRQEHPTMVSSEDYPLVYGSMYTLGVAQRMKDVNLGTPKSAGAITGDWTEYCASTEDPTGCKDSNLVEDLFQQWNPLLEPINVHGIVARHSHYIMPIGAEIDGSSVVVPFVIKPSADVGIQDMWHVGYVIPVCLIPE